MPLGCWMLKSLHHLHPRAYLNHGLFLILAWVSLPQFFHESFGKASNLLVAKNFLCVCGTGISFAIQFYRMQCQQLEVTNSERSKVEVAWDYFGLGKRNMA